MNYSSKELLSLVRMGINPTPRQIKCKHCGQTGLEWVRTPDCKWLLVGVKGGKLYQHKCKVATKTSDLLSFKKINFQGAK